MSKHVFKLPDIGEGVVEGEIVLWHIAAGDVVSEDDSIVDVMTDKATVTIPSPVTGVVNSLSGEVGEMVAVWQGVGKPGHPPPRQRSRNRSSSSQGLGACWKSSAR